MRAWPILAVAAVDAGAAAAAAWSGQLSVLHPARAGRDGHRRAVAADGVRRAGLARARRRSTRSGRTPPGCSAVHGVPTAARPAGRAGRGGAGRRGASGSPLLRLRGHYLAFATLAMQLILLSLLGAGRLGRRRDRPAGHPAAVGRRASSSREDLGYAYLAWAALARGPAGQPQPRRLAGRAGTARAGHQRDRGRGQRGAGGRVPARGVRAVGGLRRAGRRHLRLLPRLSRARVVPGAAVHRVRGDGRGRRPRHDRRAGGRRRGRSRCWSRCSTSSAPSPGCRATRPSCCRTRSTRWCSSRWSATCPAGSSARWAI